MINAYEVFGNKFIDPLEYSKIINLTSISEEDCFCHIKGDASSVEDYFKNNFDKLNFITPQSNIKSWRAHFCTPDETNSFISNNETLSKINQTLKITSSFFMEISPMSWLTWHHDYPRKGPGINLLLTPEAKSYSLFTYNLPDTSNLIECKYQPHQFCLYNTEIIHAILNLDSPRYLFSMTFERGLTDLGWTEAKEILSSIEVI